ncbi:MAG: hypothetical protein M0Z52_08685 [Actinomycetota bacterium]|nr:hypothetical protein [Actinomycetota bacterium]
MTHILYNRTGEVLDVDKLERTTFGPKIMGGRPVSVVCKFQFP